jgi:hypothetical protein
MQCHSYSFLDVQQGKAQHRPSLLQFDIQETHRSCTVHSRMYCVLHYSSSSAGQACFHCANVLALHRRAYGARLHLQLSSCCLLSCRWLIVSQGATALHVAAQQQHAAVVLAIMQHHALRLRDWLGPMEGGSRRPVDPRTW